jgi:hypothetical protein
MDVDRLDVSGFMSFLPPAGAQLKISNSCPDKQNAKMAMRETIDATKVASMQGCKTVQCKFSTTICAHTTERATNV